MRPDILHMFVVQGNNTRQFSSFTFCHSIAVAKKETRFFSSWSVGRRSKLAKDMVDPNPGHSWLNTLMLLPSARKFTKARR